MIGELTVRFLDNELRLTGHLLPDEDGPALFLRYVWDHDPSCQEKRDWAKAEPKITSRIYAHLLWADKAALN